MAESNYKTVTLNLFKLDESKCDDLSKLIQRSLKSRKTVGDRIIEIDENKVCAMDVRFVKDYVMMHICRFREGSDADIIKHAEEELSKESVETNVRPPEPNTSYIKMQAFVLFHQNNSIVITSNRDFSTVWNFIQQLSEDIRFIPRQVYSQEILDTIENKGVKSIRMIGYAPAQSIADAMNTNDVKMVSLFDSRLSTKDKDMVKVDLKFTPEKNVKSIIESGVKRFIKPHSSRETINLEQDSFSVEIETSQGIKIKKDGFCCCKKSRLDRYGSFIYKTQAYHEMQIWLKELVSKNEWPN